LLGGLQDGQTQILRAKGGRLSKTFVHPLQSEFLIVVLSLNDPAGDNQKHRSRPQGAGGCAVGGMGEDAQRKAGRFQ
jgi:hypothetical protein